MRTRLIYTITELSPEDPRSFDGSYRYALATGDDEPLFVAPDMEDLSAFLNDAEQDRRAERITEAASGVTEALRVLYDAVDGDDAQLGEVLHECLKAASNG